MERDDAHQVAADATVSVETSSPSTESLPSEAARGLVL